MTRSTSLRLVPPLFRFVFEDVVRSRHLYFIVLVAALAALELVMATRSEEGSAGFGPLLMLASLAASAPLCRSWLDEDVRLGYAALWLQKPIRTIDFYLARLLALLGWSLVVMLTLATATLPAVTLGSATLADTLQSIVGMGWIPPLLVVLAFLGSGLGARNSGLFAYGLLFAGFALPGFADALRLGPAYSVLEIVFPPVAAGLAASQLLHDGRCAAALVELWPILGYAAACSLLALALALRVPKRLTRSE